MANESTSSTLSELYTEIVAEAQFVATEQSIMRNLVRNYQITGGGGKKCQRKQKKFTTKKRVFLIGFL